MTVSVKDFLAMVAKEVLYAREKSTTNKHMLAALGEEVGELSNALIEHDEGRKPAVAVMEEDIQVAAMAVRVALEGDASFKYLQPKVGG